MHTYIKQEFNSSNFVLFMKSLNITIQSKFDFLNHVISLFLLIKLKFLMTKIFNPVLLYHHPIQIMKTVINIFKFLFICPIQAI